MKYLLVGINAKYIHSNLGIHCLRAYAKKYSSVTPEIKEYTINMQHEDILQSIYEETPDFIAFSVYIWNVDIVLRLVRDIKTLLPNTTIYLGGPEVSFESEEVLKNNSDVAGIMLGEGEQTLVELIGYFENKRLSSSQANNIKTKDKPIESIAENIYNNSLVDINGLCFRDDITGEIITTPSRMPIDLSLVPFPYSDLTDFQNRIIYYETSRGCPFGCAYCLSSVDKTLRFRSMELVKEELLFFINNNVPQVKFVDRTFNIDHVRSIEMLKFIKENDNGITNFHFEIAGDILTDEEIEIINSLRPGLVQLEIGVQSTNGETLDAINRHTQLEKLRGNVKRLLDGGKVHLHLDLIAGLPYEDLDRFKKSFNDVYSMGSHELQLGFLKVLKGAPINGRIEDQNIKYSSVAPYEVLSTKYLSYENICELKHVEEMLEIYHNSCQFMNSEAYLMHFFDSPYDFYYELFEFYLLKNQPVIQCKRAVRYELILEFANEKIFDLQFDYEMLRYFLTLDYYSREKAKARPTFSPNIDDYKSETRRIMDHLLADDIGGNYHIEPIYKFDSIQKNDGRFIVFDYNKRSSITGNVKTFKI